MNNNSSNGEREITIPNWESNTERAARIEKEKQERLKQSQEEERKRQEEERKRKELYDAIMNMPDFKEMGTLEVTLPRNNWLSYGSEEVEEIRSTKGEAALYTNGFIDLEEIKGFRDCLQEYEFWSEIPYDDIPEDWTFENLQKNPEKLGRLMEFYRKDKNDDVLNRVRNAIENLPDSNRYVTLEWDGERDEIFFDDVTCSTEEMYLYICGYIGLADIPAVRDCIREMYNWTELEAEYPNLYEQLWKYVDEDRERRPQSQKLENGSIDGTEGNAPEVTPEQIADATKNLPVEKTRAGGGILAKLRRIFGRE